MRSWRIFFYLASPGKRKVVPTFKQEKRLSAFVSKTENSDSLGKKVTFSLVNVHNITLFVA